MLLPYNHLMKSAGCSQKCSIQAMAWWNHLIVDESILWNPLFFKLLDCWRRYFIEWPQNKVTDFWQRYFMQSLHVEVTWLFTRSLHTITSWWIHLILHESIPYNYFMNISFYFWELVSFPSKLKIAYANMSKQHSRIWGTVESLTDQGLCDREAYRSTGQA